MKKIFLTLWILIFIAVYAIIESDLLHLVYRHLKIENHSAHQINRIVLDFNLSGTHKRLPMGFLEASDTVRIPLEMPDSTLSVEFYLKGKLKRIPCGYTSNGVSHKLIILGDFSKCTYFSKF